LKDFITNDILSTGDIQRFTKSLEEDSKSVEVDRINNLLDLNVHDFVSLFDKSNKKCLNPN